MIAAFAMLVAVQEAEPVPPPCGENYGQIVGSAAFSLPPRDEEREVEVGESIISSGRLDMHETGIVLLKPITISGRYVWNDFSITVPAGANLQEIGSGSSRGYRVPNPEYRLNGRLRGGIMVPVVGLAVEQGQADKADVAINWGLVVQHHPISLEGQEVGRCARLGEGGFRRELIYSGVSRGVVTIEYREFSNDMARPAFSQTLTYDLEEGRTIGFRGARFEIVSANNLSLRYRVLKHLD